jgi:predicted class III extradiol MEMO1 family dioxygenase
VGNRLLSEFLLILVSIGAMSRRATHAGSWYKNEARSLDIELAANLNRVPQDLVPIHALNDAPQSTPIPGARAIIAP